MMMGIHLKWEGFSQEDWEKHLNKIPRSNAFQDWDFAELLAQTHRHQVERCLIYDGKKVVGLAQLFVTKYLGILKHRKLIRGPLYLAPPMPNELGQALTQITKHRSVIKGYITHLQPELPDSPAIAKTMTDHSFSKIMEGYQSIWVDLRKSEDKLRQALHSKWRNQLSKSEQEGLRLSHDAADITEWLLPHSNKHQAATGFDALPPETYFKLPDTKKILLAVKHENQIVGAVLFQRHGQSATYQLSYANEDGKKLNAMNNLLWQSLIHLKKQGVTSLDLGGIEPDKNPSLARFKERMGGESFTLTGSYT